MEVQETLNQSEEKRHSMSKEAALAETASEELIERLNTDNACLGVSITPYSI